MMKHNLNQNNYEYRIKDQRTHIYDNPAMFIGNDLSSERDCWVYDKNQNLFINKRITLPEAVERIYIELITNAADNVNRSRRNGVEPEKIIVEMKNGYITVTNFGNPISLGYVENELITKNPKLNHIQNIERQVISPQAIFGHFLSSSNYDKT